MKHAIMRALSWAGVMTILIAHGAGANEVDLTAEQFLRLVKSQQSAFCDVAFAFEGERKYLGPADDHIEPFTTYQGRYALRSDGAMFLEHYFEGNVDPMIAHPILVMIGGRAEMAQVSPAWQAHPARPTMKTGGGPGSFFSGESPEAWSFLWRFQSLKGVSDFGYTFLGWENVDGHRCAHIEFNASPNRSGRVTQELWVDLERGGHPLRIKNSDGKQTVYLVDQISLSQFTLPSGEEIWFPVGGRFNQFHHKGEYTREPMVRLTSYVLNGTIVFNQGLKDGVFQIEGSPFRPAFTPPPADPAEISTRKPGVDFIDAEQKLDAALADVAREGTRVQDAASSLRAESTAGSTAAWGLGLGGAAVLVVAGYLALRGR